MMRDASHHAMVRLMRTTLTIDDDVLEDDKAQAAH